MSDARRRVPQLKGKARENRLAQLLWLDVQRYGFRSMEERVGISRGVFERMFRGDGNALEMGSYQKIAEYLGLPLWKVLELDGFDVGVPESTEPVAALARLMSGNPHLSPLLEQVPHLSRDQARAVLAYVRRLQDEETERRSDSSPHGPGLPPDQAR